MQTQSVGLRPENPKVSPSACLSARPPQAGSPSPRTALSDPGPRAPAPPARRQPEPSGPGPVPVRRGSCRVFGCAVVSFAVPLSATGHFAATATVGHDGTVSTSEAPLPRPRWARDVPLPGALDELRGGLAGLVGLPARIFWSGPDPRAVRWDLADRGRRRDLYEIVLTEGTLEDIRGLVNGAELVPLWDEMYLPPWVRDTWRPLIDSARAAA